MDTGRLRRIYESNGLMDGQLQSHQDLLKCHGIVANDIEGYEKLSDENKALYQEFVINLYNGYGLSARNKIVPTRVYWCKEINYIALDKEYEGEECYKDVIKERYSINKFGESELVSKLVLEKERNENQLIKEEPKEYLRFEFEYDGDDSHWLHVISPTEFY